MSAISVEESEEYSPDAQIPLYRPIMSWSSNLRVFCYVPTFGIKGVIIVSARNRNDADAKLDKYADVFKYIGSANTLQELLDILRDYKTREPQILNREDVWNFVYDGEEFY